jgi:hypothetical protein
MVISNGEAGEEQRRKASSSVGLFDYLFEE